VLRLTEEDDPLTQVLRELDRLEEAILDSCRLAGGTEAEVNVGVSVARLDVLQTEARVVLPWVPSCCASRLVVGGGWSKEAL
jgi:hypothetical protein